jgi:hypothetical protein
MAAVRPYVVDCLTTSEVPVAIFRLALNGPARRSFAADVHDCIMLRIPMEPPNTGLWRYERRVKSKKHPKEALDRRE